MKTGKLTVEFGELQFITDIHPYELKTLNDASTSEPIYKFKASFLCNGRDEIITLILDKDQADYITKNIFEEENE